MNDNLYGQSSRSRLMGRRVAGVEFWRNGTKRREAGRIYRRAGATVSDSLWVAVSLGTRNR